MIRAIITSREFQQTPWPQGAVCWWVGASAPAGWEIANGAVAVNDLSYTRPNLLGRFLRGVPTGATGGATSDAVAHGHTIPSHDHGGNTTTTSGAADNGGNGVCVPSPSHYHTITATTGSLDGAGPNDPPHLKVLPLVYTLPVGGTLRPHDLEENALPPYKAIVAFIGVTRPDGWALCDGATANGVITPNLTERFLRGVSSVATLPGSTGGADAHTHAVTHDHVTDAGGGSEGKGTVGDPNRAPSDHVHTLSSQALTSGTGSSLPSYIEVQYLCFTGYGPNVVADATRAVVASADLAADLLTPRGLMVGWHHGTTPPNGWQHCDGGAWVNGAPNGHGANRPDTRDRFLKMSDTGVGTAGGSTEHTHPGGNHSHPIPTMAGPTTNSGNGSGLTNCSHGHGQVASTDPAGSGSHIPFHQMIAWVIRD